MPVDAGSGVRTCRGTAADRGDRQRQQAGERGSPDEDRTRARRTRNEPLDMRIPLRLTDVWLYQA